MGELLENIGLLGLGAAVGCIAAPLITALVKKLLDRL